MHRGKWILLRASTGLANEVMTGGFYSVKLPNQARYQTSLSPEMNIKFVQLWSTMWSNEICRKNCEHFRRQNRGVHFQNRNLCTFSPHFPKRCPKSQSRRATSCATPGCVNFTTHSIITDNEGKCNRKFPFTVAKKRRLCYNMQKGDCYDSHRIYE